MKAAGRTNLGWDGTKVGVVVVCLLLAACGTRLSEEQLAATAGGAEATPEGVAAVTGGTERMTGGEAPLASDGTGELSLGEAGAPSQVGTSGAVEQPSRSADVTSPGDSVGTEQETDAAASTSEGANGEQGAEGAAKAPVVLGNVGTYSGVMGTVLEPGRVMAQVWAAHVNATGGLDGHPVELVIGDDRGDPSRAQALVRQMVEESGAIAFVGNLTPYSTSSYAGYLESVGVPAIGGDNWQRAWYESPMMFPHSTDIPSLIATRARLNVEQGKQRLGLVFCAEAEICRDIDQSFEDAARRGGGQAVFDAEASLAQPNFTAECLSARNSNVEALLMAMPADAIHRVMRDCAAQDFRPAYSACAICIPQPDTFAQDPNAEGFIVESAVFPWLLAGDGATGEFANAAAEYAPGLEMSGATAQVWAAGKLVEAAVEHADADGNLTSDALLRGLYALPEGFTVGGLTVPLTFGESGPHVIADCSFWATLQDGKWIAPDGLEPTCV